MNPGSLSGTRAFFASVSGCTMSMAPAFGNSSAEATSLESTEHAPSQTDKARRNNLEVNSTAFEQLASLAVWVVFMHTDPTSALLRLGYSQKTSFWHAREIKNT